MGKQLIEQSQGFASFHPDDLFDADGIYVERFAPALWVGPDQRVEDSRRTDGFAPLSCKLRQFSLTVPALIHVARHSTVDAAAHGIWQRCVGVMHVDELSVST